MSSVHSVTDAAKENSFVLLQIGHRRVALPAALIAELAPPVRLHTFPHATPLLAGVIVRRGRVVPVIDTEPILGGKSPLSHRFYLIAHRQVGNADELGAIPVNGECELASGEMQPPAMDRPAYVAGTLSVGEESLDVLNLDAFSAANGGAANESRGAEASR
jgi:chemotaxis signal transduction protein